MPNIIPLTKYYYNQQKHPKQHLYHLGNPLPAHSDNLPVYPFLHFANPLLEHIQHIPSIDYKLLHEFVGFFDFILQDLNLAS